MNNGRHQGVLRHKKPRVRIAPTVSAASRLDVELRDKRPPLASPSSDRSIEDGSDETFAAWLRGRPAP